MTIDGLIEMLSGQADVASTPGSLEFSAITEDSRRVTPGTVFVAAPGERSDGHDYVAQAQANGAVAVLGERELQSLEGLPYIRVPHARTALGIIAHHLAGNPSKEMVVIGVTGTNGKSSTVAIIHHILHSAKYVSASFGTLGYRIGDITHDAPHTTPFAEDLARLFQEARDAECTHVVMEVSSHAIAQERIAGIEFDVAVFTNLTQDHLDYHPTFEDYLQAKSALFERINAPHGFTVVNQDDPSARAFIDASAATSRTFGTAGETKATAISFDERGTTFRLTSPWGKASVFMPLLGRHNVSNTLAAITTCCELGIELDAVLESLQAVQAVPGRFEQINEGQDFHVIVDYAHTDDGLRNVLQASREITKGRIIALFGCGGDRDRGKRPKMAAAVAEGADFAIITSDNPRTEDPERILLDVESGMQRVGKKKLDDYLVFLERADAIECAIGVAEPGDVVLIAGKGHEDYQILGTKRIHFDDREVARAELHRLGFVGAETKPSS